MFDPCADRGTTVDPPPVPKPGVKDAADVSEEVRKVVSRILKVIHNVEKGGARVVFFTGAGISVPAGIPTFRGTGSGGSGTESKVDLEGAKPTTAHRIISKWVSKGFVGQVITQNVDGLHRKSGIPRDKVLEVHGSVFTRMCSACKKPGSIKEYDTPQCAIDLTFKCVLPPPITEDCPECRGPRPFECTYVPLHGEIYTWGRAKKWAKRAHVMIVLGSSLNPKLVMSQIPFFAHKRDSPVGHIAVVNVDPLPTTYRFDSRFIGESHTCDAVMARLDAVLGAILGWEGTGD